MIRGGGQAELYASIEAMAMDARPAPAAEGGGGACDQ